MTKEETMKQKRDELAEKHCKSFDPPIELNGDIQNCKLDFKDGFDACYQLMEAENAELKSRIEKLREIVKQASGYIPHEHFDKPNCIKCKIEIALKADEEVGA